jgi:hypothetical protein
MSNDLLIENLKREISLNEKLFDLVCQEKDKTILMLEKMVNNLQDNLATANRLLIEMKALESRPEYKTFIGAANHMTENDEYNVGQAGAVGRGAQSHRNTFNYQAQDKRTLARAAEEIQDLLKQLEKSNPNATDYEKITYVNQKAPIQLKDRVVGALQAGSEAAIEEFLDNPYVNVGKAVVKGWINP